MTETLDAWSMVLRALASRSTTMFVSLVATIETMDFDGAEPPEFRRAVRAALDDRADAVITHFLLLASQHGLLRWVRALVEDAPVDVNAANERRETALFWAVKGRQYETVEYLVAHGADVERATLDDCTPLSLAVRDNQCALVELLLAKRGDSVDINAILPSGESLLHLAARYDHQESASVLLAHGADVNLGAPRYPFHPNGVTQTPMARVSDVDMAQYLLDNGADLSGNTGLLATTFAAVAENPALVQLLLDHGADIRRPHYADNMWPPFTSIVFNQYKTMEITSAHGVDIDAKLTSGMTLLHFCMTLSTWAEVVPYVLRLGADVMATNDRGENALDLAKIYRPELVEMLRRHAAKTNQARGEVMTP